MDKAKRSNPMSLFYTSNFDRQHEQVWQAAGNGRSVAKLASPEDSSASNSYNQHLSLGNDMSNATTSSSNDSSSTTLRTCSSSIVKIIDIQRHQASKDDGGGRGSSGRFERTGHNELDFGQSSMMNDSSPRPANLANLNLGPELEQLFSTATYASEFDCPGGTSR